MVHSGGLHSGVLYSGYSVRLPISDLEWCTLGVYTLGVYPVGLPISDLEFHLPVLKKNYRGPLNASLFSEIY